MTQFDTKWHIEQMANQRERKEYLEKCLTQPKFWLIHESIEQEIEDLNRSIEWLENLIYSSDKCKECQYRKTFGNSPKEEN